MAYKVIKWRKGIPYLYEQESYREGGKVRTRSHYLGRYDRAIVQHRDAPDILCRANNPSPQRDGDKPDNATVSKVATTPLLRSTPNGYNDKINAALLGIVTQFESGDIPEAIALAVHPTFDMPCANWSLLNKLILAQQGTNDARGFRQWQAVGRHVKKGSKAFSILAPMTKKVTEKNKRGEEEDVIKIIGFKGAPVFKVEDTDGEPLEYEKLELPELPLQNVAEKWGLSVRAVAFDNKSLGCYRPSRQIIELATSEECVFFHELAHAAHGKITTLKGGQDWKQEIVAELSAAALCRLVGKKQENLGQHYKYIASYAAEAGKDAVRGCHEVLGDVDKVLKLIMAEAGES